MTTETVDDAVARQRETNKRRGEMADEIIAGFGTATVDEWKRFARAWIVTAAQHAANEEYYRGERDAAIRELVLIAELDGVAGELAKNALRKLGVR